MEPIVKIQVHEHTATVTLNRPERRNALSRELLKELHQALDDLHQERKVRGVVLAGSGSVFCAGMDLSEMRAAAEQDDSQEQWRADAVLYYDLVEAMLRFPKPLIAAVGGPAVAGGAGLVMACDFAVAGRRASFGFPEPRRGIVAGLVAPLLAFRIGAARAAYLLLTAQVIEAEQAQQYGLYQEVLDDELIWARAHQLVGEVAKGAPQAIQMTKRLLNETIGEQMLSQLAAGAAVSAASRTTEAAAEGLSAFLEKRDPEWW
ncbi:MAG: enoyl-CoA hydratase/isomerase family protein [Planctomycetota bacterium]|nr:MAG: enoyl-CoA hydratase/isomerase family protein [Planctomycetota bacterium]